MADVRTDDSTLDFDAIAEEAELRRQIYVAEVALKAAQIAHGEARSRLMAFLMRQYSRSQ